MNVLDLESVVPGAVRRDDCRIIDFRKLVRRDVDNQIGLLDPAVTVSGAIASVARIAVNVIELSQSYAVKIFR